MRGAVSHAPHLPAINDIIQNTYFLQLLQIKHFNFIFAKNAISIFINLKTKSYETLFLSYSCCIIVLLLHRCH